MKSDEEIKEKAREIIKSLKGWNYRDTIILLELLFSSFEELVKIERIKP